MSQPKGLEAPNDLETTNGLDKPVARRAVVGALLVAAGAVQASAQSQGAGEMTAASVIAAWPAKSQEVARTTIAKYGQPKEMTASRLIWFGNGPWKRTIIYRDTIPHNFPVPHPDMLEMFVDYRVPVGKFDDLAEYDGSVIAERTKGEMSARCDKEEMNILALNLAHDIVTNKRTVQQARDFYAQTAMAFMKGEKPPYTQSLIFNPTKGADPDKPAHNK